MLLPILSAASWPPLAGLAAAELAPADVAAAAALGLAGDVLLLLPPAPRDDAALLLHAKPLLRAASVRVGPFAPADVDAATSWLDAGAVSAVFDVPGAGADGDAVAAVAEAVASLPAARVTVRFTGGAGADGGADGGAGAGGAAPSSSSSAAPVPAGLLAALAALKPLASAAILPLGVASLSADALKALKGAAGHHMSLAVEHRHSGDGGEMMRPADVGRLHRADVAVASPAVRAATGEEVELGEGEGRLDVGSCLAACVRSDRADGLFTTVVSDETGRTLGLVYSNKESIIEAVRVGRGVYYSRSRGGLWRKGDTSGNYQVLLRARLDCDADALLFYVQQRGAVPAFCHLNTRTCWGEDGGLTALERTLAARLVDAPPGSYTKRLFEDPTLLRNKLLEEAQELAEATEPDHVAAEAADLLYFALVRCAKAGVTLADVEGHLDRRSLKVRRRAGDSKPYRIAAAAAFLDAMGKGAAGAGGGAPPA